MSDYQVLYPIMVQEIHKRQMILDSMRSWYLDPDHSQSQYTMRYFYLEGYKIWRELQRLEEIKSTFSAGVASGKVVADLLNPG